MAVAGAWRSISISVVLLLIVNCATVRKCTKRSLSHNPNGTSKYPWKANDKHHHSFQIYILSMFSPALSHKVIALENEY